MLSLITAVIQTSTTVLQNVLNSRAVLYKEEPNNLLAQFRVSITFAFWRWRSQ